MLQFAVEKVDDVRVEIQSLIEMHWEEIAVWQDIPLEPHWKVTTRSKNRAIWSFIRFETTKITTSWSDMRCFSCAIISTTKVTFGRPTTLFGFTPTIETEKVGRNLVNFWKKTYNRAACMLCMSTLKVAHPALGLCFEVVKIQDR
jgi:hypothetical protein